MSTIRTRMRGRGPRRASVAQIARFALLALVTMAGACRYEPPVPDGRLRCSDDRGCPSGARCTAVMTAAGPVSVCCASASCGGLETPAATGGTGGARNGGAAGGQAVDGQGGTGGAVGDAAPGPEAAPAEPDLGPGTAGDDASREVAPAEVAPEAGSEVSAEGRCPTSTPGPALVRVRYDRTTYCIDATEVTNADYQAFLSDPATSLSGQAPVCSWNRSYVPDLGGAPWPYAPGTGQRPVVNVDWCDAAAYCKWAKKRLCGKLGGGPVTRTASRNIGVGEWITACTGGEHRYPYGDFFDANACNTEAPAEQWSYVENVGKRPTCEGGFKGIFDLAGNVEEWIDACDGNAGAEDSCEMYGGHAWRGRLKPDDVSCRESNYPVKRRQQYQLRGFRCCADPVP